MRKFDVVHAFALLDLEVGDQVNMPGDTDRYTVVNVYRECGVTLAVDIESDNVIHTAVPIEDLTKTPEV